MIYVVATTQVKPDQRDAFIKGHKACIAETLKEKGCLSYEGHTAIHDPNPIRGASAGRPARISTPMARRRI